jgi:hypothetical protein
MESRFVKRLIFPSRADISRTDWRYLPRPVESIFRIRPTRARYARPDAALVYQFLLVRSVGLVTRRVGRDLLLFGVEPAPCAAGSKDESLGFEDDATSPQIDAPEPPGGPPRLELQAPHTHRRDGNTEGHNGARCVLVERHGRAGSLHRPESSDPVLSPAGATSLLQ